MERHFENVAVYLIGFPGVGKYTIAKALSQVAPFRVVDNHYINNPIFGVIEVDGFTPLPDRVWKNAARVREAVFDTIVNVAPKHLNYVLTNHLGADEGDAGLYEFIEKSFVKRGSLFVPVVLTCELGEHKKRITADSRKLRLKEINPEAPERYNERGALQITHPNKLVLDVTHDTPVQSVEHILDHVKRLLC